MKKPAFTLLEIIISLTILAVLATAVVPTTKKLVKREKEIQLKRGLHEMRQAIDRFKRAAEQGLINIDDPEQLGYPKDLEELLRGAPLKSDPSKRMRFLRRIPVDPFTGEANWGFRSVQDDPEANSWGRENLFDVYSLSDGTGLDGSEYSSW